MVRSSSKEMRQERSSEMVGVSLNPLYPNFWEVAVTLVGLAHIVCFLVALYIVGMSRSLEVGRKVGLAVLAGVVPVAGPVAAVVWAREAAKNRNTLIKLQE